MANNIKIMKPKRGNKVTSMWIISLTGKDQYVQQVSPDNHRAIANINGVKHGSKNIRNDYGDAEAQEGKLKNKMTR